MKKQSLAGRMLERMNLLIFCLGKKVGKMNCVQLWIVYVAVQKAWIWRGIFQEKPQMAIIKVHL